MYRTGVVPEFLTDTDTDFTMTKLNTTASWYNSAHDMVPRRSIGRHAGRVDLWKMKFEGLLASFKAGRQRKQLMHPNYY